MLKEKLTVIIVSYNSFSALVNCMDEWLKNPGCRILVIDNASSDDSARKISERYPGVEVIAAASNLGYGRGANRGLAEVQTSYALLLNPDINASVQDACCLVESADRMAGEFAVLAPAVTERDFAQQGLQSRQWVIGAAMLFNMEMMAQVGFFDENIFLFSEETDLCRRVVSAGLPIYLDSDIYLRHLLKQSSTPSPAIEHLKNWHMGWSRMYYRRKHGLNVGKKAEWRVLASYWVRSLTSTNPEKRAAHRARFEGSLAFMKGLAAYTLDGKPRQAPVS